MFQTQKIAKICNYLRPIFHSNLGVPNNFQMAKYNLKFHWNLIFQYNMYVSDFK